MNEANQKVLNKIESLTNTRYNKLLSKTLSTQWDYVGSQGKNDGNDAHWMRIYADCVQVVTSTTYGENGEYFLAQETVIDLELLKSMAESVIPFGDCIQENDPETEDGLANIINNICFNMVSHGCDDTDTVSNFDMSLENDDFNEKKEHYVNLAFNDVAERYDIPFEL